ncbi:MAG: universal stress protein [Chloroflexi bacterium]|nr:universal stress protein [Chloroflexota bacterium]
MKRKVLVPLDGSAVAEQMLPWIRALAQRLDLTVCLVQVLDPAVSHVDADEPQDDAARRQSARTNGLRYLNTIADDLRSAGIRTQPTLDHGPAVEGILVAAVREQAELIAMSTHGRSGLSRWLYGSVAEGVLRGSRTPVLLYRARTNGAPQVEPTRHGLHVLVPLDGTALSEQVLPVVVQMLGGSGLEAVLLGVVEPPEAAVAEGGVVVAYLDQRVESLRAQALAYLEHRAGELRRQGIQAQARVELGRPAEWIAVEAQRLEAAFIAMATHARGGLDRVTHGSVADEVLRSSAVPVLLVRGQPAADGRTAEAMEAIRSAGPLPLS